MMVMKRSQANLNTVMAIVRVTQSFWSSSLYSESDSFLYALQQLQFAIGRV